MAFDRQYQIAKCVNILKHYQIMERPCTTAPNTYLRAVAIISDNVIAIKDIIRAGSDVVHRDKILLCRSILLPPERTNRSNVFLALLVLRRFGVTDGELALRVDLYNFSKQVPAGTILAIMHPWFKNVGDCSTVVRCDNPKHVVFIKSSMQIVQNVIWKADLPTESRVKKKVDFKPKVEDKSLADQGTYYYVEKNYTKALELYTKAIEQDPKSALIFSNRALTYLTLQKPSLALADTEKALAFDESHLKSLYRKAKALLMLKRYKEAVEFLFETQHRLKKELDGNREFSVLMRNAKRMLREFDTGGYNMLEMEKKAKKCKILENHADYAAPIFEIKEIQGKGRGLVATGDIPAGRLVMACKAFAFATATKGEVSSAANYSTKKIVETSGFTRMVRQICDELTANPDLGRDFYQLYAGPNFGPLDESNLSKNPIDVKRVSAIVKLNAFGNFTGNQSDDEYKTKMEGDSGLWLLPSYLNHSCGDFNCIWGNIGDVMFVRAKNRIERGQELLIAYTAPWKSYKERRRVLKNQWGFECGCSLCVADRQLLG